MKVIASHVLSTSLGGAAEANLSAGSAIPQETLRLIRRDLPLAPNQVWPLRGRQPTLAKW